MKNILTGRIAAPMIMFMADTGAPGIGEVQSGVPKMETQVMEMHIDEHGNSIQVPAREEGEQAPNFDELDLEEGNDPPERQEPVKSPANAEEQAKKEAAEQAKAAEELKKAEEAKKAAKKPAATDPAKPAETKPLEKPAAEAPKSALPTDDSDIDAIKPKPGSNPKITNDFDRLKVAAKEARALARAEIAAKEAIAAEKTALETKLTEIKPISPEIETELKELKEYRARMEMENDPELTKEFTAKMSAADERLFSLLRAEGLTKEDEDKIKATGIDKMGEKYWKTNVLDKLADTPIIQARVQKALLDREQVKEDKAARIASISADKEGYTAKQAEEQKKHWEDFSQKINKTAAELAKGHDWANPIPITAEMKPEDRTKAEAHNKLIDEGTKEFQSLLQELVSVTPEAVTRGAFAIMHAKQLQQDIAAKDTAHAAEVKRLTDRAAELESEIAAITRTGKITQKSGAPVKVPGAKSVPNLLQTVDEALDEALGAD